MFSKILSSIDGLLSIFVFTSLSCFPQPDDVLLKTVSSIMANISTRTWTFFSFPICGIVGIWERTTSWDGYNFLRHCFLWKQCNAVIHVDCWDQKYILAHSLVWNHWILVFAEKTEIERDKATGTPYISRKSLCTTR